MKTIFDNQVIAQFQKRIDALNETNTAKWGKMNAFQMVRHCCENERMLLRKKTFKNLFIGKLFGKIALKKILKDDAPMGKNKPTHPDLKINTAGDVSAEKEKWKLLLGEYLSANDATFEGFVHPFFGKMSKEQIGVFVYKHTNHHLTQFGV